MSTQPYPDLSITRSDLEAPPCSDYDDLPDDKAFNPFEEMEERGRLDFIDVSWLIVYCQKAQKPEIIEYSKTLNPKLVDVSWLIRNCPFAQTSDMMAYLKTLNPTAWQVSWLIKKCSFAQTPDMMAYFKSLNPTAWQVLEFVTECPFAKEYFAKHPIEANKNT